MERKNKISSISLFTYPLMLVQLDLDLEKLTEFAYQLQNENKKGVNLTNRGGWHSADIDNDSHEELNKLKKEITQHLQMYHSEVFRGMKFKGNVIQSLSNMWVNINEKHHYNEWHIHPYATLSGVFYIKHNGAENGDILFKHPNHQYMSFAHCPANLVELPNRITSGVVNVTPNSNMLILFPAWLEHKADTNLKNDTRISLSFNSFLKSEKNNG
tara:strand:- start:1383 stop:2024 length:642 start_codon:yes stop_codon:yes gene_type:complete